MILRKNSIGLMEINITKAKPILIESKGNDLFRFQVNQWHIKGRCLAYPDECQCKTRDFDFYIDLNALEISKESLIELVIGKLK